MTFLTKSSNLKNLKTNGNMARGYLPDKQHDDIRSFSSKLLSDLYKFSLSKNKLIKFFFNSRLHLILILEILNSNENEKSFEYLCEKIDKRLGKRTTIQKILNDAIKIGVIAKAPGQRDRRIKYFKVTNEFTNALEDWILKKY